MVERLPDITSPDYATEEEIAVHTCAVAFIGERFTKCFLPFHLPG